MPQMNRIALSRSAIFVCEMDGRSLGLAIRTAQPLGMTSPPYVWIITGEAYRWLKLYEPATISMLSWALVIFPQGGTGDAYTWMTERWNTTDFQSRYPTLTGVYLDPPDEFLPYHACLDLLIRGYDAISHANNTNNISQIASGWSGPIIPKLNVSTNFSCPKYQTVLGYMDFTNGNTVIAPYKYYYLANGKLNYFGYSKSTTDLEIVSPIIFSDGSEVIPSQTIAQFAPEPFNWKLVILAPLIAVVLIFLGSGGLLYLWLAAKHRRRTELDLDTKPLGHIPKFDLSGTAQKAMELLRDARDPAKKRKITLDDIDFLMEVLNSGGTNAFNPMLELQGPEGVKVDAETRAWVLGMLATGGQSSSVAASGGAPIPVSRQSSDSTNPDIRRVSRGLLDGKRQSAVEKSRTSMMPDSMSGIAVGSGGIVMGYEPQGATSMVGGAQGLRQRRGSFGGMTSGTTPRTVPRHLADSFESTRSGMVGGVSRQLDDPQYHTPLTRELSSTDQVKIMDYLSIWYHSWNFDMFQFNEMTDGHPLYYSGVYLFQSNQALNSLHLDLDKFKRWILLMEGEYHPHPYHNATHAADVLHALNFLLIEDPIGAHYTPLEVLALVMSAVGHDIDHPGYNNNFLVKSHHPWAILYCDASVLELHHCAHMFSMTLSSPFNIFADLTNEEFDELRRIVIRLILATDMGKHFEYINKFKAKLTASTLKFDTVETRMIVAEIALKCSDLCNPTKTFALSSKWTEAVMEEFYMQGDRERELGLAISQFMDRGNTNVPKCQIGFIDILVAPLYDAWATFQTTEKVGKIVREIGKNRQNWVGLTLSQTIHAQNQQGSLSSGQSTTSVASRTPGMASTTRAAGFAAGLPSVNSSSGALGGSRLAGSGSIRSGHESVTSQSQDLLSSSPFPPVPSAPTGPTSSIIPTTTTTTATAPGSPLTTPYLLHHQQSHPSQQQLSASALSNPRRPGLNSSQTSGGGSTTNTSITPVGSLLRHREMGQDIRDLGGVIMNTGNEEIDTLAGLAADDRV
ncbi:hypothetical protein DFS34DRAFT_366 [Phlyctochytrium arcticum]|nr:hypothetical protein DFS34DRAFT_366 [Phlyctochytrium arcticum]